MRGAPRNAAPKSFVEFLWKRMKERDISLNQLAAKVGVSPAFLSRILSRERGLPSDKTLVRLAEVLDVEPRERLLIEAGRIPDEFKPALNRPLVPTLLRAAGKLSESDLQDVIKTVQALALRKHKRGGRP
jgi:HTH-type transcriptional regulator, competence development regulator